MRHITYFLLILCASSLIIIPKDMGEYIVSARKYRPASFDAVVGQRALTTTLLNAIRTGKLAHAYLFCGPRGVGKTTCARIFAKTINCTSPSADGEACNQCESCRSFDRQTSMNIHELDAASNNGVDNIRELTEQVRIPPQGGKYKVFIIDEVHMLSQSAFNAFLKTLEEPPSYVIFILATTEKHKILPTILSRCQVYDFARMSVQNTVDHLAYVAQKEGIAAEPQALNLIAQKADGGMRDALSIFDQMASFTGGNITYQSTLLNLNVLDCECYFRLIDHFLNKEIEPCLLLFNEVLNRGFSGDNFVAGLASHARDLLVSRDPQTLPLLEVGETLKSKYQEQAARCKPQFLIRILKLCNDCDTNYRQSRNKRLQVELCLIQAAQAATDDDPGHGRKPDERIKPIFQQTATAATAQKQNQTNPTATQPQPTTSIAEQLKQRQAKKSIILDLNDLCINPIKTKKEEPAQQACEEAVFYLSDKGRLTERNLMQCWQQFANTLQEKEVAMSMRLRGITPSLTNETSFSVTASNDILAGELAARKKKIESFFSRHIGVPDIQMSIAVSKPEEAQQAYSKPLILKRLMERNSSFEKLVRGIELELA